MDPIFFSFFGLFAVVLLATSGYLEVCGPGYFHARCNDDMCCSKDGHCGTGDKFCSWYDQVWHDKYDGLNATRFVPMDRCGVYFNDSCSIDQCCSDLRHRKN